MKHFVEGVIDNEGEGVILRRITSLYEPGRSPALIKLKVKTNTTQQANKTKQNKINKTKQNKIK